jgi:hypothetical protein
MSHRINSSKIKGCLLKEEKRYGRTCPSGLP